jgi:hypothetical protein
MSLISTYVEKCVSSNALRYVTCDNMLSNLGSLTDPKVLLVTKIPIDHTVNEGSSLGLESSASPLHAFSVRN